MATLKLKPNSFSKLRRQIQSVRNTLKYIMALDASLTKTTPNPLINPLSLLLTILCNEQISPKMAILLIREAKTIIEALEWLQVTNMEAAYKRRIIQQLSFLRDLATLSSLHSPSAYATLH